MFLKAILTLIFGCSFFLAFNQNLIPNSDFEAVNLCEQYNESCAPKAWKSTSLKLAKFAGAENEGTNKFMRLLHFDGARNFDRRFLQVELLHPIEAGKTYELSFVCHQDYVRAQSLGFLFSSEFFFEKNNLALQNQVDVLEIPLSNQTSGEWQTYKLAFRAKTNASHLIIGNFLSDSDTKLLHLDKKVAKRLKKSYQPQNRVLLDLDNIMLEPIGFTLSFDHSARETTIFYDNIRHRFETKVPPIVEQFEVGVEEEVEEVIAEIEQMDRPLQPGLNTLQGVEFEFGTTNLTPLSLPNLEPIVAYLKEDQTVKILILGHTDNVGSDLENLNLSKERAQAIQDYLIGQGINSSRLSNRGLGSTRPIAENDSESGRQKNRRVEVEIKD